MGGRLKHADTPNQSRHQIILLAKHQVTPLGIHHYHETTYHSQRDETLSLIRQSCWVVNGNSAVRKILQRYLYCKRIRVQPQPPIMADLPDGRVGIYKQAFSYTGIDFFGPLVVKQSKRTRTTWTSFKRYGAVFTCSTTYTVNLVLVDDLTTNCFLLALVRLMARRGKPKTFWTDNGTNFIDAEREPSILLKDLNQAKIDNTLINKGVTWKFNPPSSPWMWGLLGFNCQTYKTIVKISP